MKIQRLFRSILLCIVIGLVTFAPVIAAQISVDQVELGTVYPLSNIPWEINPDGNGNLIVSDDYGSIWVVNPMTKGYTLYDTGIVGLADAHMAAGGYWFTDYSGSVGFTNLSQTYLWEIPLEEGLTARSMGPVAIDHLGGVWAIEYDGSKSKIHNVNRNGSVATICTLVPAEGGMIDYGTYAYDLTAYGGYLWWYNWFDDLIVRFNPVPNVSGEYTLDYWSTGIPYSYIEGHGNSFDSEGNFWISGGGAGTIYKFNPGSGILSTYSVPGATSIEGVAINNGKVWATNMYGSVLVLTPNMISPQNSDLSGNFNSMQLKPPTVCSSPSPIIDTLYDTKTGILPFSSRTVDIDSTNIGWAIVQLSENDLMAGIGAAQGIVLAGETYNVGSKPGILLRFSETTTQHKVYLPLIKR